MKPKPDHFSLTDCRKTLAEHEHPLLTLTKGEYENLISKLEKARELLERVARHDQDSALIPSYTDGQRRLFATRALALREWLANLEPSK